MSDDYGYQVRRLETQTGSMESELYSLRSKLGEVEDLDDELRDIRGDLRSLEDDLSTVRNELTELDTNVRGHIQDTDQALKRLTGRVQTLEAHLLAAGGAPRADLDTIDPQWTKLARTADHGWHVRSGLLPRHQREAHRLKIREYEGAVEERNEHRDKVVEAAGILASRPRTSREFMQAVIRWWRPPASWPAGRARPASSCRPSWTSACPAPSPKATISAPSAWPAPPGPRRPHWPGTTRCGRPRHP
ncbi:hypothetical protein [Streptomyces rimosus]|uniref:hypothetical protein n=1 Tax=Streptomyces rimosus TaxID=1927 RepID=UPI0006B27E6C|nr:hypothetical protein [Streptomyces rimosus]KOT59469.1 hypothetical protein ADK45_21925 [Streptomyces rimosus subsp. rimosus]